MKNYKLIVLLVAVLVLSGISTSYADQSDWRTRVNLDKQEFTEAVTVPVSELNELHVIVNKRYKVPDNYVPSDLVKINSRDSVKAVTKEAFDRMVNAASAEGGRITAVSGFRTIEYQRSLYNKYLKTDNLKSVDTYSARPGFSEHHTGFAIDIAGSTGGMLGFGSSKESAWIEKNAHKYGFIVRYYGDTSAITGYKSEPWHIRYVGEDIAGEMKEQGIRTLEEYVGRYILGDPIKIYLDGTEIKFDQKPTTRSNRTLAPMRTVFEAMGADVVWDNDNRIINAKKGDTEIQLQIGNPTMKVNNTAITLDVAPRLIKNTTYVPLRAVSESLDATVEWNQQEQAVYIKSDTSITTPGGVSTI